uniref:Uncharacterized protein n=1 Tax=Strongyloides venezuelensis TaxID=75913 RepID=A0A0K0F0F7_STRVS
MTSLGPKKQGCVRIHFLSNVLKGCHNNNYLFNGLSFQFVNDNETLILVNMVPSKLYSTLKVIFQRNFGIKKKKVGGDDEEGIKIFINKIMLNIGEA